jgi:hypothetical protein
MARSKQALHGNFREQNVRCPHMPDEHPLLSLPVASHSVDTEQTVQMQIPYGVTLAGSLIRYADMAPEFTEHLLRFAATLPPARQEVPVLTAPDAELVLPTSTEHAIVRMLWLMLRLTSDSLPGAAQATDMLAAWAHEQQQPDRRQLIVGVVKVAIPGITLGRLSRKADAMSVLLRPDVLHTARRTLLNGTLKTVLNTFGQAMQLADGNLRNLEPEMLDWFLGEKDIAFYTAPPETLARAARELDQMDVPHAGAIDRHGYGILAISPAVSDLHRWPLVPLV